MSGDPGPGDEGPDSDGIAGRIVAGARSAARWIRWLPDRLLHPLRRRSARRRLRGASPEGPVLFVCHGNICRSPYAEAVLCRRSGGRLDAGSVGLVGPDRPSPETAREVARERGVELEDHRSRLVTRPLLREAGLVVVMDPRQARALRRRHGFGDSLVLGDLDPEPIRRRPIRDPIFQPPELFRQVYARIDRCIEGLIGAMGLPVGSGGRDGRVDGSAGDTTGEREHAVG